MGLGWVGDAELSSAATIAMTFPRTASHMGGVHQAASSNHAAWDRPRRPWEAGRVLAFMQLNSGPLTLWMDRPALPPRPPLPPALLHLPNRVADKE